MTTKINIEKLYEEYKAAMYELYDEETIKANSLEPKTQNSFQRSMSRKAGISLKSKEDFYTDEQIIAIINDTQTKLKEYQDGNYSEALAQKGTTRYSMFLAILQKALERLGLSSLIPAEEKSDDKIKEEMDKISDDEVPFYTTEEEEIKDQPETKAMNEEEIIAMIPSLIEAVPKFIQKSHEAAKKVSDLQDQIITISNANLQLIKELEQLKEKGSVPETDDGKRKFIEEIAKQIEDTNIIKECSRDLAMLFVTKG